ncbi:unnamed protein product, partial [Timema podura]|nr:unnamed protein product [Timema podura]
CGCCVGSAAVEVTGEFLVDAYAVESGLKLTANLHTATGADLTVKASEGLGLDVKLGLPLKEQDVLTVSSQVLSTLREQGQPEVDTPLKFNSKRNDYRGCFDQLSPLIGLTFCGEVGLPWEGLKQTGAFFPLNGPGIFSVKIETDDVSVYHIRSNLVQTISAFNSSYSIHLLKSASEMSSSLTLFNLTPRRGNQVSKLKKILYASSASDYKECRTNERRIDESLSYLFLPSDPDSSTLELVFDTPGSKSSRKIAVLLERTIQPQLKLAAIVTSPWKKAAVYVVDTANEYSLNALLQNDQEEYSARLGAKKSGSASHQTYIPILEYKTPEGVHPLSGGHTEQGYGITGSVVIDKSDSTRKYTLKSVSVKTPKARREYGEPPPNASDRDSNPFTKLAPNSYCSFSGTLTVDGTLVQEKDLISNDLKWKHEDNEIHTKSKLQRLGPSGFSVEVGAKVSKFPNAGFAVKWDYHRDTNKLDNSLIVTHGQDLNSETARVTLIQSARYRLENVRNFEFETKNKVTYPLIGLVVKVDAAASPSAVSYDVEGGYDNYKFGSELDAKCKGNGNFEIEFELEALGESLEFEAKRTVISKDKSKLEAVLELKPGGKYQLVTDLTHIFKQNDVNLQVDALLKLAGRPEDIKGSTAVIVNKELLELFAKLSSGSNEYLDIDWKLNRAVGKPSGDIKVFLKGLVEANAQYKYVSGKGSATLNIDLPKQGRKIKGTGDLAVTGSNHVASVDLYWDADKDSKKSLHFETNSDITKNSLDSKNSLVVLQQKTTLNVKGTLKGKLMDGHLVGQADLTLPKSRQLTVKLDRTLHLSRGSVELDGKLELVAKENAASSGNLLSLETKIKAEEANQLLDSLVRIALKTSQGKDLSASVVVKNTPQREQRLLEASVRIFVEFLSYI